jgi:hypothetical protein
LLKARVEVGMKTPTSTSAQRGFPWALKSDLKVIDALSRAASITVVRRQSLAKDFEKSSAGASFQQLHLGFG